MSENFDTDVIVIGAGLAGATAARELGARGVDSIVLEARDRLGGRLYTEKRFGKYLELGGNWMHWTQPHVWAEITRYGLEADRLARAEETFWFANGEVRKGDLPGFMKLIDPGMEALVGNSGKLLPRPDLVADSEEFKEADQLTLQQALDALDLSDDERQANEAAWVGHCNGPLDQVGFSAALRWTAATSGAWKVMHEASSVYRLKEGNDQLVKAIAGDIKGEVRLDSPVTRIEHDAQGVSVTVEGGQTLRARKAILTAPLNILHELDITPALSEVKREASQAGTASQGVKLWMRVKGPIKPFFAYSTKDHPLSVVRTEFVGEQDAVLVSFGADASRIDVTSIEEVQKALSVWRDDIEILELAAHDWNEDPYAKETWLINRPLAYTQSQAELQRPEGNLHLAGADIANLWAGFFDGAIESGLRVAREVSQDLYRDVAGLETAVV
ncbi:FAD-dependent oxidoreductase [Glutamicibacter halophytocola]|uniref:FAD-dependent oxidoreductase n=2 Tax=Glutamicibacter halophytocola TaxID=1933880 RepID=A0ABX5YBY0_9MICC|nr:NAD(P)/FAD-dependent oxidoreductase [Glutamicibacter halophytocola]NQD41483.1 FAD-dependent oxidoreductase [Glutamicibacter halophytocola]QDY67152.1 FAD-dependent oxidoreductase [Glutamicibacter halophytocola]